MATFYRADGWVKTVQGQAVAGAQVFICTQPADAAFLPPVPLASIFADPLGLVPITQPIYTDGFGHYDYYAASGVPYTEVVVNNGSVQAMYPDQVPMGATLGGSGGGSVTSVFGRTGSIVAMVGDYNVSQITGAAPSASPSFTGTIRIVNAVITGTLQDGGGSVGTPGQLLSSTGTGTAWVTGGGGGSGTVASGAKGQIGIYASAGSTISGFSNAVFYPETYGAVGNGITDDTVAIQAAITAAQSAGGGTVQFGAKTYLVTASLTITSSNVILAGVTSGSTTITCNSASADIIQVTGTGAFQSGTNIFYTQFRNLRVSRSVSPTGTASGFHLILTNNTKFYNVESFDSSRCFWHGSAGNALTEYQQCEAAFTATTTTGTVYGWYLDGGNFGNFSGRNLDSLVINAASGASTIYGLYLTGAYVADLYCEGFETSECHYGVYINALTSGTGFGISNYQNDNIHFVRCIQDNCQIAAYSINNLYGYNSYVEISGGYVAAFTGASTPLIDIENSAGVIITNVNIRYGGNGTGTNPGVYINGSHSTNNIVSGNSLYAQDAGTAIAVNGANGNTINNNAIYGYAGAAFTVGIRLTGASFNTIDGNNLSGTGTTGISLDASSNSNGGVNVVDPTSITTPLSNSGSSNFVTIAATGGGSTGLTSLFAKTWYTTSQRVLGNIYQNTTGQPLVVMGWVGSGGSTLTAVCDSSSSPSTVIVEQDSSGGFGTNFMFIVPNNDYYEVTSSGGSLAGWVELEILTGTVTFSGELSGSRALSTVYQNTSGKAMMVVVDLASVSGGTTIQGISDAGASPTAVVWQSDGVVTGKQTIIMMVPNGHYYEVTCSGASVTHWNEYSLPFNAVKSIDYSVPPVLRKYIVGALTPSGVQANTGTGKDMFLAVSVQPSQTGSLIIDSSFCTPPGTTPYDNSTMSNNNSQRSAGAIFVSLGEFYSARQDAGSPTLDHWWEYTLG
jgi:parallel beta-helix repeat protein